MSVKVRIEPEDVKVAERTINGPRGSRIVAEQRGYVQLEGEKYPRPFRFTIPDGSVVPYQAGEYTISPRSFQIGKYEKLELNPFELYLNPIKAAQPASQPARATA